MARILYGLAGEGMGHAMRSKVVIEHLKRQGHEIRIVTSNRAADYMASTFDHVTKINGLILKYEDNKVKTRKSLLANLKLPEAIKTIKIVRSIIEEFRPDLIITDYEPTIAHLAGWKKGRTKIPVISIDNMHVVSNCTINVPAQYIKDQRIVKYGNDILIPPQNVNHYIITTFFYPNINRKNTTLVPSLVRGEIIRAKPTQGNHVLVYQTSTSNTQMFDILRRFPREIFIIYGFNEEKKDGNLHFRKFNEKQFIDDFSSSKALLVNGGFTTISEAVYLHKPVLSIPVQKHFEQICNALAIQDAGYGEFHNALTPDILAAFLYRLPEYQHNLNSYKQDGNKEAFRVIDATINGILKLRIPELTHT